MTEPDDSSLTPEDMRGWLKQEVRDLLKAMELRIQDATEFVTAYAVGEISEQEVRNRHSIYQYRWGDSPIPGVMTGEGMTNAEILKRLDDALPAVVRESIKRRSGKSDSTGPSR